MSTSAPTAPTAPGVRSWRGILYTTAERYRRPVVANFDPNLPYDRKSVVSAKPVAETVGNCLFEGTVHYQQALDLWEGIDCP